MKEKPSFGAQLLSFVNTHGPKVFRWLLASLVVIALLAQLLPPLGDFVDSQRFFGVSLLLAIALVFYESLASINERLGPTGQDVGITIGHYSELRRHVADAFRQPTVSISIAAYSGETLYSILSEPFAKLQRGEMRLRTLSIRLLLPDYSQPIPIPCTPGSLETNPAASDEARRRTDDFISKFVVYVGEIQNAGSVDELDFTVKQHPLAPQLKVLILNNELLFASVYPILETKKRYNNAATTILDFRGAQSEFLGFHRTGSPIEKALYLQFSNWYESVWTKVSHIIHS